MFKQFLVEADREDLKSVLSKLPKLPQRQDGSKDQLRDLIPFANKLGMYDAADVLKTIVKQDK